jgi:hypothetical protein
MKGMWIYDEQADVWHLLIDGKTWCTKVELPLNAPVLAGHSISWSDTLHDECVRKSEELEV